MRQCSVTQSLQIFYTQSPLCRQTDKLLYSTLLHQKYIRRIQTQRHWRPSGEHINLPRNHHRHATTLLYKSPVIHVNKESPSPRVGKRTSSPTTTSSIPLNNNLHPHWKKWYTQSVSSYVVPNIHRQLTRHRWHMTLVPYNRAAFYRSRMDSRLVG